MSYTAQTASQMNGSIILAETKFVWVEARGPAEEQIRDVIENFIQVVTSTPGPRSNQSYAPN